MPAARTKKQKPDDRTAGLIRWRADRSDQKRELILEGARREFLSKGFGGARVDMVAEAAGVAKTTVYRHFESKEALFAGVVARLCDRIVGADFALSREDPPQAALKNFGSRVIETVFDMTTVRLQRIVIAEEARFPELGQLFYASGPAVCIRVLSAYLEENRERIGLGSADLAELSEHFLENLRGYLHLRVLLGIEGPPDRDVMERRVNYAVGQLLAAGTHDQPAAGPRLRSVAGDKT